MKQIAAIAVRRDRIRTQKETDLLQFFCQHPNKILKRKELLTHVWARIIFIWAAAWMCSLPDCVNS